MPKITPAKLRQVDAPVLSGVVAGAAGLFAHELGVDPLRAAAVDFARFSVRNPIHALASDARAMAVYLVSTGFDVPVSDLARAMALHKQAVSRMVHRAEDMRGEARYRRIFERVEQVYGVEP